jgi:hypothetical protein
MEVEMNYTFISISKFMKLNLYYKLDVNTTFIINTLPNRKMKKFDDDVVQMNFDRKRTEEGRINKTCALVPK